MQKQRDKILREIKQTEKTLNQKNKQSPKIDFKQIKQIADEFLKLEKPNKMILEQLIKKIEFDKEKQIKIKLTFENPVN